MGKTTSYLKVYRLIIFNSQKQEWWSIVDSMGNSKRSRFIVDKITYSTEEKAGAGFQQNCAINLDVDVNPRQGKVPLMEWQLATDGDLRFLVLATEETVTLVSGSPTRVNDFSHQLLNFSCWAVWKRPHFQTVITRCRFASSPASSIRIGMSDCWWRGCIWNWWKGSHETWSKRQPQWISLQAVGSSAHEMIAATEE